MKERGFGLLQALVAVVVVGALLTSLAMFLSREDTRVSRTSLVQAEARDLMLLDKALRRENAIHKDEYAATWFDGQPHGVPSGYTTLITDDKVLPEGFAHRFGDIGYSPFGQRYGMLAYGVPASSSSTGGSGSGGGPGTGTDTGGGGSPGGASSEDRVVWVIYEGAMSAEASAQGLMKRAGVAPGSPVSIRALKREIADFATSEHGLQAGVIAPGSTTVVGSGNAWQIDLSDRYSTFPTSSEARVAVLVNWPELESDGPEDYVPPGDTGKWDKVRLIVNRYRAQGSSYPAVNDTCDRPGEQEIVAFPVCGFGGGYLAYATDVGTITFGTVTHEEPVVLYGDLADPDTSACWPSSPSRNDPAVCRRKTQVYQNAYNEHQIFLNGAYIGSDRGPTYSPPRAQSCTWHEHMQGYVYTMNSNPTFSQCMSSYGNTAGWTRTDPWVGCVLNSYGGTNPVTPVPDDRLCGVPVPPN